MILNLSLDVFNGFLQLFESLKTLGLSRSLGAAETTLFFIDLLLKTLLVCFGGFEPLFHKTLLRALIHEVFCVCVESGLLFGMTRCKLVDVRLQAVEMVGRSLKGLVMTVVSASRVGCTIGGLFDLLFLHQHIPLEGLKYPLLLLHLGPRMHPLCRLDLFLDALTGVEPLFPLLGLLGFLFKIAYV